MILSTATIWSIPLLFNFASAITHDCEHIRADGVKFNFKPLDGQHSVSVIDTDRPPSTHNTTWTVNICKPIAKQKGIDQADQCKTGTYVCGIDRSWNPVDDPDKEHVQVNEVISVAGDFSTADGRPLDPHYERLKAKKESDQEGLEVELNGGIRGKKKQKAIINFICDKDRTGNEGIDSLTKMTRRADSDDDDDKKKEGEVDDKNSLKFISYGDEEGNTDVEILRLDWRTKYACEDHVEEGGDKKGGWGFFTWLILLLFLGTAAYLIFGSWLNYNRYGARGWDLLPHGDTIRDIPYLFKDWSRKVVDTVSGSGSRGGYSAV